MIYGYLAAVIQAREKKEEIFKRAQIDLLVLQGYRPSQLPSPRLCHYSKYNVSIRW